MQQKNEVFKVFIKTTPDIHQIQILASLSSSQQKKKKNKTIFLLYYKFSLFNQTLAHCIHSIATKLSRNRNFKVYTIHIDDKKLL